MPDSVRIHAAISEIESADWDALAGDNPFLRHAFLNALETTGCASAKTGWQPAHLTLREGDRLAAAMPLYLKSHSYGEFVFDWAWADAYHRHGLHYYPKLLCAVPFSPVTGLRLLGEPSALPRLAAAAVELAGERELSSIHCLFPTAAQADALSGQGWLIRTDCQFHWRNRGYRDFDDFLDTFSSAKRKKVRRERRRVAEAGIHFRVLHGGDLDAPILDAIYRFYCLTYFERGRTPYLNREFFAIIAEQLGRALVIMLACRDADPVGAAICLRSGDTLYGRHWGSDQEFHSLHFETCYYQGIDYCLREGLQHFDPGAQGQHKISRGFEPTATYSAHWIADLEFREAIAQYLSRERSMMADYREDAREHLPFKSPGKKT
ncbi:MAG TPA: GNAT family N-acetyltransferase [Gammaproteobacteria bacterium]|nr:GNAT family N-acetyltransferase [Gammaproteobacteria bacterium]